MGKKILYLHEMDYLVSLETYFVLQEREDNELTFDTEDGSQIWHQYLKKPALRFVYNDAGIIFRSRACSFILNEYVLAHSVEELINLNTEDFYTLVLDHLELTDDKREYPEIVYAAYESYIEESYTKTDEDLIVMKDVIFNTESFKSRLNNVLKKTFKIFMESIYTEEIQSEIKREVEKYQNQLATDEKLFARNLTVFSASESDYIPDELRICMLYFASQEYIIMIQSLIVLFGREIPFYIKKMAEESSMELFVKAMSDPIRYKMIKLLSEKSYFGSELAEALDIPITDLEKHIGYIQRTRLLKAIKGDQNRVYFEINKVDLERALEELKGDLLE